MISKQTIDAFLGRPLDDWRWIKMRSALAVQRAIDKRAQQRVVYKTLPFKCQLVGLYLGLRLPTFLYLYDMGIGKTKIVLEIIRLRKLKALVLCDNLVNAYNWYDQTRLHTGLRCRVLEGNTEQRWKLLRSGEADVWVINYTGLLYMVSELRDGKMYWDKARVEAIASMFSCLVLDEIQNCKNKKSLTFRICKQLARRIKYRYGLTGTPMGTDPEDLWAEFFLIDNGASLGSTLGLYREAFFTMNRHLWGGWMEWHFDKRKYKLLYGMMQHRSVAYADNEVKELPQLREISVSVPMADDAMEAYRVLKEGMKDEDTRKRLVVKGIFMKLLQLSSACLKSHGTVIEYGNNKVPWLVDAINAFPHDDKVVVFHYFRYSGGKILAELKKAKIKAVGVSGTVKQQKAKQKAYSQFLEDKAVRVFVTNSYKGLNLQVANRVVFYELPVGLINFRQALKRCHRTGQTKRTYVYYLLSKKSIEEKHLRLLQNGADLLDAIVRGKEKL